MKMKNVRKKHPKKAKIVSIARVYVRSGNGDNYVRDNALVSVYILIQYTQRLYMWGAESVICFAHTRWQYAPVSSMEINRVIQLKTD